MSIARVPAYSPYAVAEHAIALLMSVNRRITAASTRVKMSDFTLDSSLLGMDIHGKTVGVMGTGKIGKHRLVRYYCVSMTSSLALFPLSKTFCIDTLKCLQARYCVGL